MMVDCNQEVVIMWRDEEVARYLLTDSGLIVKQNPYTERSPFRKPDGDITLDDLISFVDYQIFDEHNANKEKILASLGLRDYAPWDIFYRTRGVSWMNSYWVRNDYEEDLLYERDIKSRDFLYNR